MSIEWIWQKETWPDFPYDEGRVASYIKNFDENNAITLRDVVSFENKESDEFVIYINGLEAFLSSKIEGERADLPSLVNSIRANFNIMARVNEEDPTSTNTPRRKSIAKMMVDLYRRFDDPLSKEMLNTWNISVTNGERLSGEYRQFDENMEIISLDKAHKVRDRGTYRPEDVEYIAPPSHMMDEQMQQFIEWYNDTSPQGKNPMHPMIRAGLAHLYFVAIHPYHDGNGRMARAIAVKAISECNGEPTVISLSHAISDTKNEYYNALKQATKYGNIDAWLDYFCKTTLRAQELTKEKLYRDAVIRTIEQRHPELSEQQKRAIRKAARGDTKKIGIITASDYVECNKEEMRKRAKEAGKGLIELAMEDLLDMAQKKVVRQSSDNPKSFKLHHPPLQQLLSPSGVEKIIHRSGQSNTP